MTNYQATQEDKAAITAVNKQFSYCFANRDIAGMTNVYTKTGQLLPPGQETVIGHDAIHKYWSEALANGPATADMSTVELEQHGDTAIEIGAYIMKDALGEDMEAGKLLVIWKKIDGEWKWHRDIWNPDA